MGNIIAQVAAPANMETQAKGPARSNGAESFSIEMDEAVKNASNAKTAGAEAAKERGMDLEANGEGEKDMNDMKDMKETGKGESATTGLLQAPVAVPEMVAGLSALTGPSEPAERMEGQSNGGAQTTAAAVAADLAKTLSPEDAAMKGLDESALIHKYFGPEKKLSVAKAPEDAKDEMEVTEEGNGRPDAAKAAVHGKGVKGEFAAPSIALSAADTVETSDLPEARTAGAAAITLEQADDSPGGGFGNAGRDDRGPNNQAGQRATETFGVNALSRQAASYEAVAVGGELTGAERAEVYEKLSTGVSMSIARDGGEVKLLLRPDHLGNLNIKLNIEDGKVNARIVVESAAVKEALDADSGTLREVFAKNSLVLDKYSVEIAGRDFSYEGNFTGFSGFSGFENNHREGFLPGDSNASAAAEDLSAATGQTSVNRVSGIDLFI